MRKHGFELNLRPIDHLFAREVFRKKKKKTTRHSAQIIRLNEMRPTAFVRSTG